MTEFAAKVRRSAIFNQVFLDAVIAGCLTIVSLITVYQVVPRLGVDYTPLTPIGVVLLCLQTVPLVFRQRFPTAVLTIAGWSIMIYSVIGYPPGAGGIGILFALYSVASNTDRRTAICAAVLTMIGIAVSLVGGAMSENLPLNEIVLEAVANYVIYATAWIVGDNVRVRRAYTASLEARAAMLERERGEHARLAVAEERARIARELHDVVAHHVSVMVVQAGAARRILTTQPALATEALDVVETTGRQALVEMRRMLGVLRSDEPPENLAPQPSLDRLDALIDQVRDAGLDVELTVEGARRPLPPGVDVNAYRIVQEALTNVLKHAGQARATVRVRFGLRHLDLEITDNGRGAAAAILDAPGDGQGLVGMRERVHLHAGALEAGPLIAGGYRVRARLQIDGPAPGPATPTTAPSMMPPTLEPAPDPRS
jgi:signal transduction histidine kinase